MVIRLAVGSIWNTAAHSLPKMYCCRVDSISKAFPHWRILDITLTYRTHWIIGQCHLRFHDIIYTNVISVELWEVIYVKHFLTDRHDLVRKAAGLKQCHESSTFPWYHGRTYDSVFDIEQSFSSHQYTSPTLKSTCWSCYLGRKRRFFRRWEHPSSQIWRQQQVSHARITQLGNDVISIWVSKCLVLKGTSFPRVLHHIDIRSLRIQTIINMRQSNHESRCKRHEGKDCVSCNPFETIEYLWVCSCKFVVGRSIQLQGTDTTLTILTTHKGSNWVNRIRGYLYAWACSSLI